MLTLNQLDPEGLQFSSDDYRREHRGCILGTRLSSLEKDPPPGPGAQISAHSLQEAQEAAPCVLYLLAVLSLPVQILCSFPGHLLYAQE